MILPLILILRLFILSDPRQFFRYDFHFSRIRYNDSYSMLMISYICVLIPMHAFNVYYDSDVIPEYKILIELGSHFFLVPLLMRLIFQ